MGHFEEQREETSFETHAWRKLFSVGGEHGELRPEEPKLSSSCVRKGPSLSGPSSLGLTRTVSKDTLNAHYFRHI